MRFALSHLRTITFAICLGLFSASAFATALDDYIALEDPAFTYGDPLKVVETNAYNASVYRMTSQHWLDESLVDRTEWWHWVTVIVPKDVHGSAALLFINGGSNREGDEPPTPDIALGQVAVQTKSVLIEVKQIPNQRLKFTGEQMDKYKENGRTEDELIAYGWDKFLNGGDPVWLARFPMTKAIVRAMDLVQKEVPSIESFFVAGGSKRGWTTWTTAAVDERVMAISPAVIDVLNMSISMDNHMAAYGFWAPAVGNYGEMDIFSRRHTPRFRELQEIVDPYFYRDRLTMPKYIVNSSGDQFFAPDSWKFYYDDLVGEKYLRYIPNTDHGLSMEAYFNMASFYQAVRNGTPRPEFSWKLRDDGQLELNCTTRPKKVLLWQAINEDARDFRKEIIGAAYTSAPAEPNGEGLYTTTIAPPDKGWTAFFLEVEFTHQGFQFPFKFTTGIQVLPETLPHEDKAK
jgi:PhoPQ-activated pathogenicity-related protein